MTSHWSAPYIGLPYADFGRDWNGSDCYGLVRLVLRDEKGITVPSYNDVSPDEISEIADVIKGEVASGLWVKVPSAREFDAVVFRRGRFDSHIGVMLDSRNMLHSDKHSGGARIERVDSGRWKAQFVGFYRHRDLI